MSERQHHQDSATTTRSIGFGLGLGTSAGIGIGYGQFRNGGMAGTQYNNSSPFKDQLSLVTDPL